MAYKDKTLLRAYAENKRERISKDKYMREDMKQEAIHFVYSIENEYLAHRMNFDDAMENIACTEEVVFR